MLISYAIISFLILVLYGIVLRFIASYWSIDEVDQNIQDKDGVSIIIAARNEEDNIEQCVQSCIRQSAKIPIEIIVVNDGSSDKTLTILEQMTSVYDSLKVINNIQSQGKKAALKIAIENAKYDKLLFTDADCMPSPDWVKTMNSVFVSKELKLLAGPIEYIGIETDLKRFQYLDGINNMAMTNAGIKSKQFYSANGANIMYLKSLFYELNGYDGNTHLASGDDVFLIQKAAKAYSDQIDFCNQPDAIVKTLPEEKLQDLKEQRKRWATKTQSYDHKGIVLIQGIVFLMALYLFHFIFAVFIDWRIGVIGIAVWIMKAIMDYTYLSRINTLFSGNPFKYFWKSSILYVIYILVAGYYAIFPSMYEWKGRKVK